jgi:hypothetical protein
MGVASARTSGGTRASGRSQSRQINRGRQMRHCSAKKRKVEKNLVATSDGPYCMQHDERISQHSKTTSATFKKITPRKHRDLLLQHYNMRKIMAQHQLILRATWSRIPQHSKATSATLKNNICNIEICFCNNHVKHLQHSFETS